MIDQFTIINETYFYENEELEEKKILKSDTTGT